MLDKHEVDEGLAVLVHTLRGQSVNLQTVGFGALASGKVQLFEILINGGLGLLDGGCALCIIWL